MLSIRAEIISIGDELTSGQRLDTNSQWLSIRLAELGVSTAFHTTVGDTLEDNIEVFRIAARRADIVVSTGGLGPTADDLTREAMAAAFDRPLELRPEAMAHIESLFAQRRRPMPERNRVQALFPATSRLIPNPHGTAPGIDLTVEGSSLFALPGVPAEMIQMWHETVIPRLLEMGIGRQRWFYRVIKVFGIGESDVEAKLPELIQRDRIPRVGITVSKATISLRIACLAENEQAAIEMSRPTEAEIHSALGDLIFGEGEEELDDVVHQRLREKGESLSLVEIAGESIIAPWLSRHRNQQDIENVCGLVAAQWLPSLTPVVHSDLPEGGGAGLSYSGRDMSSLPEQERESASSILINRMKELAEYRRVESNTDWCLVIGPYPVRESVESQAGMPTCSFVIALAGRNQATRSERFELGGHPS